MKRLLLLLMLLPTISFGQYRKITGMVLSEADSLPISFAHVYADKAQLGTVSNQVGEYLFVLDERVAVGDTISFSSIGYQNYHWVLEDTAKLVERDIYLPVSTNALPALTVHAEYDSLAQSVYKIVSKALDVKTIKENYPTKPFYGEAFYRELIRNDTAYLRLTEAAIAYQDYGINKALHRSKVKTIAARKSDDYNSYSLLDKAFTLIFGKRNAVYDALINFDWLKKYVSTQLLFKKNYRSRIHEDIFETGELRLEEIVYEDSVKLYKVAWMTEEFLNFQQHVEERMGTERANNLKKSYLYINASNYAIQKMDFYVYIGVGNKFFYTRYLQQYRQFKNQKYYKTYISKTIFSPKKGGTRTETTLLFNDIYTSRKSFTRIKNREKTEADEDFYKAEHEYDPDFWKNYNMVKLVPLDEKAKESLSREKELEEQFRANGKEDE